MKTNLHFSSAKSDWETPQKFFDVVNSIFRFNVDVCATKENTKLPVYIAPEKNSLTARWADYGDTCWMNPPYGQHISKWVEKAYKEYLTDHITIVCLLPARTDTKWFQDYCSEGNIIFLRGRLKFGNHDNSAPFPSCLVVFGTLPPAFAMLELKIVKSKGKIYFQGY